MVRNMRVLFSKPDAKNVFRMVGGLRERKWLKDILPNRTEVDLGLLYVATALDRAGHETVLFDTQLSRNAIPEFIEAIRRFKPDLVALNGITGFVQDAAEMADEVKKHFGIPVVLGGHHATALPQMTLEQFSSIDYAVSGEGEITAVELLEAMQGARTFDSVDGLTWRDGDKIVVNRSRVPIKDLDALPFPDRTKVRNELYHPNLNDYVSLPSTNVSSSRGCPHRCTFCARTGARLPVGMNMRSPENVLEEIRKCQRVFGIHDIRFVDDTVTNDRDRMVKFCETLIRVNYNITWSCYSCPNEVDPELLALMKKSGCFLVKYGIETGSDEMLRKMKKGFTVADARNAVKWTREARIECFSGWIIGMPGETPEQIDRTIDFAVEISPDVSVFASLALFPGSIIFKQMYDGGHILHYDWRHYLDTCTPTYDHELPGEVLNDKVLGAFRRFYLRPSFIWQKIKRFFLGGHPVREVRNIVLGFVDLL